MGFNNKYILDALKASGCDEDEEIKLESPHEGGFGNGTCSLFTRFGIRNNRPYTGGRHEANTREIIRNH